MIHLNDLIARRVKTLLAEDPRIELATYTFQSDAGEWGNIMMIREQTRGPHVARYEFIETDTSWKRPEAMDEYNVMFDQGFQVAIFVPEEVFIDVVNMINKYGRDDIKVYTHEEVGTIIVSFTT